MTIKPLGDRVLLKLIAEEKTSGGILLPTKAQEAPQIGEVIAVGPGTDEVKMTLKVGDRVIFPKFAGNEINDNGVEMMMLQQKEILALVE